MEGMSVMNPHRRAQITRQSRERVMECHYCQRRVTCAVWTPKEEHTFRHRNRPEELTPHIETLGVSSVPIQKSIHNQ